MGGGGGGQASAPPHKRGISRPPVAGMILSPVRRPGCEMARPLPVREKD